MNETSLGLPTPDERVLAALTHGLIVLGPWGFVISAVIWATQKERSPYVRFQALQALVYQICETVLVMLSSLPGGLCGAILGMLTMFGVVSLAPAAPDSRSPTVSIMDMPFSIAIVCSWGLILLIRLAFIAYGLYGAVQAYRGRDFRYAVIGPWLARRQA